MKSKSNICIALLLMVVTPLLTAQNYRIAPAITDWLSSKTYEGATRRYTQADLDNVPSQVMIALQNLGVSHFTVIRNEMFARHGYIFKTPVLSAIYNKVSWYKENPQTGLNSLTAAEVRNVNWIKSIEDKYDYQVLSGYLNNKTYTGKTALYAESDVTLPTDAQLALNHLYINTGSFLRNEIFARNGLQFTSGPLKTVYAAVRWYKPRATDSKIVSKTFNNYEQVNIALLKERGWIDIVESVKFSLPEGVTSIPVIGFNSLFIKQVETYHFSYPDAWTAMEEKGEGIDGHLTDVSQLVDATVQTHIMKESDPRRKLILYFSHKKYKGYVDTIQFNSSDLSIPQYLQEAVLALGLDWRLLLRKEIHARNGARFIDPKVGPIFRACPWYRARYNLNPRTVSRFPSGVSIKKQELRNYSLLEGEELWGRLVEMNTSLPQARKACDLLGNFYYIKIEQVYISGSRELQVGHAFDSPEEYRDNPGLQSVIEQLIKSYKFNIDEYREQEQVEFVIGC